MAISTGAQEFSHTNGILKIGVWQDNDRGIMLDLSGRGYSFMACLNPSLALRLARELMSAAREAGFEPPDDDTGSTT